MPFKLGDRVRIKENAFDGSNDPRDIAIRGKEGSVAYVFSEDAALGPSWDDCYEIEIEDELWPVCADEMEKVQD